MSSSERSTLYVEYVKEMVKAARHMLFTVHCEHPEHRTVPKGYNDWESIDRCMANITYKLTSMMSAHISLTTFAITSKASTRDDMVSIGTLEMLCKTAASVLEFHYELIVKYGRGNNADLHYDQIMNMMELKVGEMVAEASTPEKFDKIHDKLVEANENIKRWFHTEDAKEPVESAFHKPKKGPHGETMQ